MILLSKAVEFFFGKWGLPVVISIGMAVLWSAWKIDRWSYGKKQFAKGSENVRVDIKKKTKVINVKADKARARARRPGAVERMRKDYCDGGRC